MADVEELEKLRAENAKLKKEIREQEDSLTSLRSQLRARMTGGDRGAVLQSVTGIAARAAQRSSSTRLAEFVLRSLREEVSAAYAKLCFGAWVRQALLARATRPPPPAAAAPVAEQPAEPKAEGSAAPAGAEIAMLQAEAAFERSRGLAAWTARAVQHSLMQRSFLFWRQLRPVMAQRRLAEWSARHLHSLAEHGLLAFCFFSFRRFVKGSRRPGTTMRDEDGDDASPPLQELSLLTPAALCNAVFSQQASRRLRLATVWSAWWSVAKELRQDRVAVALHDRFEEEHDLMDQRIIYCRDAVVKEKLRRESLVLMRWMFDVLHRWASLGRFRARSQRREEELEALVSEVKRAMDATSERAVAIIGRLRHDPKPWSLRLIFHFWVTLRLLSKEEMGTEAAQRRLEEERAEVSILRRYVAAAASEDQESGNRSALEDFEAAGRAALGYADSWPPKAESGLGASSSSAAFVGYSDGEPRRPRVPAGRDFASTMAYLRQTRDAPTAAGSPVKAAAGPPPSIVSSDFQTAQSIGTNSALWAKLDELDGYMAGMSGRMAGK